MKFKDLEVGMKLTYRGEEWKCECLLDDEAGFECKGSPEMWLNASTFDLMEWELVREKRYVTLTEASAQSNDVIGNDCGRLHQVGGCWLCEDGLGFVPTLADLRGETRFEVVE